MMRFFLSPSQHCKFTGKVKPLIARSSLGFGTLILQSNHLEVYLLIDRHNIEAFAYIIELKISLTILFFNQVNDGLS